MSLAPQLTILIPTSPIPSHPSTAILDETVEKIRSYDDLRDCTIFIMFDGVHPNHESKREAYSLYVAKVLNKLSDGEYGRYGSMAFSEHTHQANMTKAALSVISTPLIMFVEHDTAPIGDIPFKSICKLVENSEEINYIRFHIFHEILKEHEYLMLDKQIINNVPLIRTIQWSQRPHIAKASWYRNILERFFHGEKTMIEDVMHSIVLERYKDHNKEVFGLAIYAPEGNMLRSYHSDARGDDQKIITG